MAQQGKVLSSKPDDLSSRPRSTWGKERPNSCTPCSDPLCVPQLHTHAHTSNCDKRCVLSNLHETRKAKHGYADIAFAKICDKRIHRELETS